VPSDAPLVGHRHGGDRRARFGRGDRRARAGVVGPDRRDAYRRARDRRDRRGQAGRRHLPSDKFQRSNQSTCINQKPLVRVGDIVAKGDIIADGPSTDLGDLSAGAQRARRVHAVKATTSKIRSCCPKRIVKDDVFTSIHIEEFEAMARDDQARTRGNHPRHPQRFRRGAEEPRRRRHCPLHRAPSGARGTFWSARSRPKGESPMTPGREAAARHLLARRLSDVRDTLASRPARRAGDDWSKCACSSPWPLTKDERAQAIEREEFRATRQGPRRQLAILDRNVFGTPSPRCLRQARVVGPKGSRRTRCCARRRALIERATALANGGTFALESDQTMSELKRRCANNTTNRRRG